MGLCISKSSVEIVESKEVSRQSKLKSSIVMFKTLPNMGSTCYFNVALQMLFRATEVRKYVYRQSKQFKEQVYHRKLSRVFKAMQDNKEDEKKIKLVKELIQMTEKSHKELKLQKQQDVAKGLNAILEMLRSENEKIYTFFALTFRKKCKCDIDLEYEQIFVQSPEFCVACNSQIKMKILKSPKYLLVISGEDQRSYLDAMQIQAFKEESNFQCIFFASYYGDKASGHYTACVQANGQYKEINDDQVHSVQSSKIRERVPRIMMFALKESNEKKQQ